jgi:hypothetical protein
MELVDRERDRDRPRVRGERGAVGVGPRIERPREQTVGRGRGRGAQAVGQRQIDGSPGEPLGDSNGRSAACQWIVDDSANHCGR